MVFLPFTGEDFGWKWPFWHFQPKNPDLDNYASESGVYPGFQRAFQRLLPDFRELVTDRSGM
jgi:choline dehydrogenase-like flavoprotein